MDSSSSRIRRRLPARSWPTASNRCGRRSGATLTYANPCSSPNSSSTFVATMSCSSWWTLAKRLRYTRNSPHLMSWRWPVA